MTKVYKIWCEYDIGQDERVFSSIEAAEKYARELCECQKDNGLEEGYEGLVDECLIGFGEWELDPE